MKEPGGEGPSRILTGPLGEVEVVVQCSLPAGVGVEVEVEVGLIETRGAMVGRQQSNQVVVVAERGAPRLMMESGTGCRLIR